VSFYFFFASRRRHTISKRDWSSDVCSSDLLAIFTLPALPRPRSRPVAELLCGSLGGGRIFRDDSSKHGNPVLLEEIAGLVLIQRSEERRVGQEWRSRG